MDTLVLSRLHLLRLVAMVLIVPALLLALFTPATPATASTESVRASAPIANVLAGGNASINYIRVCGWLTYQQWGCREYIPKASTPTVFGFGSYVVERGVYADIHFFRYGVQKCDLTSNIYRTLPNGSTYQISYDIYSGCHFSAR